MLAGDDERCKKATSCIRRRSGFVPHAVSLSSGFLLQVIRMSVSALGFYILIYIRAYSYFCSTQSWRRAIMPSDLSSWRGFWFPRLQKSTRKHSSTSTSIISTISACFMRSFYVRCMHGKGGREREWVARKSHARKMSNRLKQQVKTASWGKDLVLIKYIRLILVANHLEGPR